MAVLSHSINSRVESLLRSWSYVVASSLYMILILLSICCIFFSRRTASNVLELMFLLQLKSMEKMLKSNQIISTSLLYGFVFDPLFFYIPFIDQDNKCIGMDKKLWIVSLFFRSYFDFFPLVHFIYQICQGVEKKSRVFHDSSIINDFLALLPIPHLLIGVAFYQMWGPGSLDARKFIINFFLIAQYIPRIYKTRREFKKTRDFRIMLKSVIYFLLYLFASHVLGALWYFFSIQQEISCWQSACVNHSTDPKRCMDTFYCDRRTIPSRNITFLNEHCPTNISDGASSAPFNFGIYLDALKTGTVDDVNFSRKFFYCFWWGLRNISNFGTNLMTSTYVWENLFAINISIISFLLLTLVAATATAPPQKSRLYMKKLDSWNISGNDLPDDLKTDILSCTDKKEEENEDDDLENDIFSILPAETRKSLQCFLCMKLLKTVPVLEKMNTEVLEMICDYLKPVTYNENSFIFRMGDPLDCMLFIVGGTMWTYSTSGTSAPSSEMAGRRLGKGQFYGEELLNSPNFTQLPISTQHVKTRERVQAFALMADDLATAVAERQQEWDMNKCTNNNSQEVEDDIVEI